MSQLRTTAVPLPPILFQTQGTMSNATEESPPPSMYHDASPLTMHPNPDDSLYADALDGIINHVDPNHVVPFNINVIHGQFQPTQDNLVDSLSMPPLPRHLY
jgi:hypothetical protein